MKIRTNYTAHLIKVASCFRAFPMFWNVASARREISLRKLSCGSAHLRTFRGALVAENALC